MRWKWVSQPRERHGEPITSPGWWMGHLRGKSRSQREIRCGLKKIFIWVEGKKCINPSIYMYRNLYVMRVNNLEIRAIRPSNRSRRDLKGEMSRIKPWTRLLMLRRGRAEVVKCGWNTSTLTFTWIPTCYPVAQLQPVNGAFKHGHYWWGSKKIF